MVIVSVMLVAALTSLGSSAKAKLIDGSRQRGPALAQQLMAEILQCYYEDPQETPVFGPEPGEPSATRSAFDDLDDYDGWQSSPPTARDGTTLANSAGWTQSVWVDYVEPADPTTSSVTETELKRIIVAITDPQGRTATLTALRSKHSSLDQAPITDTTTIAAVTVELRLGNDSSTSIGSASILPNRLTPPASLPVTPSPTVLLYPSTPP